MADVDVEGNLNGRPAIMDEDPPGERLVEEPQEEEEPQEAEEDDDEPVAVPRPLGPFAEGRMVLTSEEHGWAVNIKNAVAETPDLDTLTDFWCAQLALVHRDNLEAALERAHRIQAFREEYSIVESYETGRKFIHKYVAMFPGMFLSCTFSLGNYVLVLDLAKFHSQTLQESHDAFKVWITASYFLFHIMNPDLEAVRRGFIMLAEVEGYEWRKNFGTDLYQQFWCDIAGSYPSNIHQVKYYHTPVLFNVLVSMVRRYLPKEYANVVQAGCVCEMGRLDNLYLLPNAAVAKERLFFCLEDALQRRYKNEASFSLG